MQGLCKDIGVSNFGIGHLEELLKVAKVTPAVNQIELSPFLQRKELVDYCNRRGIALEVLVSQKASSILMRPLYAKILS